MKATAEINSTTPTELQTNEDSAVIKTDEEKEETLDSTQELIQSHPEVEPILEKLNRNEQQVISTLIREESFSGPIPHPKHLKGYADVYPDAPEKIFSMAEKQQQHRHSMEKESMKKHFGYINTGMFLGFLIAVIFLIGGFVLIVMDKEVVGLSIIAPVMIGLVTMFVRGNSNKTNQNNEEIEAKSSDEEKID